MQYSISNLNAFVLLVSIGFSLYPFVCKDSLEKKCADLLDKNNSPIQLIVQLKGYFHINPVLALSLAVTLFSFVGIPPLIGFFAKQMVLSAALDTGYVFLTLLAILTSVISAVYYLSVIKQMFFDDIEYKTNETFVNQWLKATIIPYILSKNQYNVDGDNSDTAEQITLINSDAERSHPHKEIKFNTNNIVLSSSLTITVSILTLVLLLFIFTPQE